ncbi:MAG TPA: alcohol dehydrogenase catalytic domain-containing protein, partial [bacterium]|nr:alcohol dehydrogenase catalytic domain-containing protein [bacterium]
MRAMRLHHPAPIERAPLVAEEVPRPAPGPEAVLVRVEACAVCHTDLHLARGELPPRRLPVIPGHQAVGRVVEVGCDVPPSWVGRRVGVAWLHRACGTCAACARGDENLCERPQFTGYDVDGGFAEWLTAPAAFVYEIPDRFDAIGAAPLLCAGIIGYRALRLAAVTPGAHLGLFGFGASAHLAIQVARHWGCEVSVVTRSAAHRRLAEALGARWVGT